MGRLRCYLSSLGGLFGTSAALLHHEVLPLVLIQTEFHRATRELSCRAIQRHEVAHHLAALRKNRLGRDFFDLIKSGECPNKYARAMLSTITRKPSCFRKRPTSPRCFQSHSPGALHAGLYSHPINHSGVKNLCRSPSRTTQVNRPVI